MHQVFRFIGYRARVTAVSIHDPQVVAAVPIAHERDPLAIRTVAGLIIPFDAIGQRPGFTALDRDGIDVAQHVENQCFAVRADGHIRPGRLAGVDAGLAVISRCVSNHPLIIRVGVLAECFSARGERDEQQKGDDQQTVGHDTVQSIQGPPS